MVGDQLAGEKRFAIYTVENHLSASSRGNMVAFVEMGMEGIDTEGTADFSHRVQTELFWERTGTSASGHRHCPCFYLGSAEWDGKWL